VNVDSLIHPYETHVPDQSRFNLYDISSNKLLHDDRGNWHMQMVNFLNYFFKLKMGKFSSIKKSAF
jgi:hypothetical protein